jgi:hypothetical protein
MPLQSSLHRIHKRLRSRQHRLHSIVAQDVRELRSLLGQRVSVVEVIHLPGLEVTPPVEHFDLRGATARQVQALRFVEVSRWFPP